MRSLLSRFSSDMNGFCGSEYALAALISVTLACWGAHNLKLKSEDAFATVRTSVRNFVPDGASAPACKT